MICTEHIRTGRFRFRGKIRCEAGIELVLDFSRKDAVDFIFDSITEVLDYAEVEYLKWDMNRSLCDVLFRSSWISGESTV